MTSIKNFLKNLVYFFGYSCLVVSACHQLYAFYLIQIKDIAVFMIQEPNLAIRYFEIATSIFGVAFAFYLFISWIYKFYQKEQT